MGVLTEYSTSFNRFLPLPVSQVGTMNSSHIAPH